MPRPQQAILDPEARFTRGERWDWLTIGLLVWLLAFAPAAFGAVEAWSELIVVVTAAALAVVVATRSVVDREFGPAVTWLYLPAALFILLIACQLLPLPAPLARLVSPATVTTKAEMLGSGMSAGATTISFYPRATREELRLVLVGATVLVVVAMTFRRLRQIKILLLAVFAIGCGEALLAIAQIATETGDFYWRIPSGRSMITSGTFVNYSHFSQFMNLSLGTGIALLLLQFREHGHHEASSATWRYSVSQIGWEKYGWLFCGMVLCAISVLTSMSRNGAMSMLIAASVVGAALYWRGAVHWKGWLLGAVPLVVFTALLIFGFDMVYERLATLQDSRAYESRWEMTAATLRAWSHYPLWGTGLGTHEYVFPMFDRSVTRAVATHADNDYAQLLEETGVVGAAAVAAFLFGVAALVVRLARRRRSTSAVAAFGLAYGLIAVFIHSVSDFGQRIPANLCLSATICGLLVAISLHEQRTRSLRTRSLGVADSGARALRLGLAIFGLVGVVGVFGWAVYDAYRAYLGEQWWWAALEMESRIAHSAEPPTDIDYADLIRAAGGAFDAEPDNVKYGYWLNTYRWQSLSRTVDPETGDTVLHHDVLPFVARIADELAAVRELCPTYGPPYALEGQLRLFVLHDQRGAELIRKGVRLAAYDPPTCLVAGQLAAREGKLDEAERLLTRAVELQPGYFADVVDTYLQEVKRPDLARSLAGDDYGRLEQLAQASAQDPAYAKVAEEARAAAAVSLRQRAASSHASPSELVALARLDLQQQRLDPAIELFRRALHLEYAQVEWRLELARALTTAEQYEDALHEVQVCLRLRPQYAPAVQLQSQLVDKLEGIESRTGPIGKAVLAPGFTGP